MAINRAQQSWPEEMTLTLVEHEGELKPSGRLLAMKMLLEKYSYPTQMLNGDRKGKQQ